MCGLCVAPLSAELVPPNIAVLGRRLYGKYLTPPLGHLRQRVIEIQSGAFQADFWAELKALSAGDLRYATRRQIEADRNTLFRECDDGLTFSPIPSCLRDMLRRLFKKRPAPWR